MARIGHPAGAAVEGADEYVIGVSDLIGVRDEALSWEGWVGGLIHFCVLEV